MTYLFQQGLSFLPKSAPHLHIGMSNAGPPAAQLCRDNADKTTYLFATLSAKSCNADLVLVICSFIACLTFALERPFSQQLRPGRSFSAGWSLQIQVQYFLGT